MTLSNLPREIRLMVAEQLVPTLKPPGDCEGRWLDTSQVKRRCGLLSLTKTCRTLRQAATPSLYHTIFIDNAETLLDLLGTIISKRHLARHIRVLAISLQSGSTGELRKIRRIYNHITHGTDFHGYCTRFFSAECTGLESKVGFDPLFYQYTLPLFTLAFLFSQAEQIESLSLYVYDITPLCSLMNFVLAATKEVYTFMGNLKRVEVVQQRHEPKSALCTRKDIPLSIPEYFMQHRRIRHLVMVRPTLRDR